MITIHPCPFDTRPCDSHNCRNALGYKKYFIGRPDTNVPKPIFCEKCIAHLIKNLPSDLVPGQKEVEEAIEVKLRKEITEQYDAKLKEIVEAERVMITQEVLKQITPEKEEKEEKEEAPEEPADESVPEELETILRCLDCGEEFENEEEYTEHIKTHEAPKRKRKTKGEG